MPSTRAVQASIGIALCPRDGASVAALLRRADEAMYVAKSRRSGVALADAAGDLGDARYGLTRAA